MLVEVWSGLGGDSALTEQVVVRGEAQLPCYFAVAELATSFVGSAALALAEFAEKVDGRKRMVTVDSRLASGWFHTVIEPQGWEIPPFWHPLCADYRARDGWVRLHTNIPSHCQAVVDTLGIPLDRDRATSAVATWDADDLEAAVLANGGAAARLQSRQTWLAHPQGRAVAADSLVEVAPRLMRRTQTSRSLPTRPLRGIRVLDLTRGVAGPVATRFLAGYGADVLRIDPPKWDEPAVVPDVSLGKRRARLDLKSSHGRWQLRRLVATADIVVHGYRPGALEWLELGDEAQDYIPPGLIDVSLNAYGWSGPWRARRGFDSLVQMSTGMAHEAMEATHSDRPVHLPFQALDQATGYLMAAAALRALTEREEAGTGARVRCSLARTAEILIAGPRNSPEAGTLSRSRMFTKGAVVQTDWGPARRLPLAVHVDDTPMEWEIAAGPLGVHEPVWEGAKT
jgi:crotonobetainyl-CoA:carnitine CoA-transferase CaiB-like acyl-CoA transferase